PFQEKAVRHTASPGSRLKLPKHSANLVIATLVKMYLDRRLCPQLPRDKLHQTDSRLEPCFDSGHRSNQYYYETTLNSLELALVKKPNQKTDQIPEMTSGNR